MSDHSIQGLANPTAPRQPSSCPASRQGAVPECPVLRRRSCRNSRQAPSADLTEPNEPPGQLRAALGAGPHASHTVATELQQADPTGHEDAGCGSDEGNSHMSDRSVPGTLPAALKRL